MYPQQNQNHDWNAELEIKGQRSERLIANHITVRQGIVQSAEANTATLRQTALIKLNAESADVNGSKLGLVQSQKDAHLSNSSAGAVVAGTGVVMDQSSSKVIVAGSDVNMDQSAAAVMVTRNAVFKDSSVVFLIAQNVEGELTPLFGSREALLFGAAAGLVGGVILLLARSIKRR
ncbi:hypothetical protein ATHL_01238 [Anaerolinea thermolimosa]|uniref:hypothetical protein n=1 Tax=Anaerolinea thermolimosa TaxID=229919 RepID=UPI000783102B|nr:hypothetical protein [Anaerolinea thermolimosa]GAP06384.1 hypothetical protein ATHL_01238 [Anaerolinea thermolimosa]